MTEPLDETAWAACLRELVDSLGVPGAVLAVSHGGERIVVPAGVAGLRNPVAVTADTVFQLGSISKLYTATLLLSLTGVEILDRPVAELVPEAGWMEPSIRVRHLLTHSSGLGGDWFHDSGRGDDCLARYVAELAEQPRDVPGPPGERYSYCNSGFAVLGRLIEVLCAQSFDDALAERLLAPLGATATSTLPEQTILHPVALGHNCDGGGPLTADTRWNFPRSCGPLGGICATAGDLLTFAELHLADGRTRDGTQLLDAGVARLMRERQLECPPLSRPNARGLAFCLYDRPGAGLAAVAGHDGETLGQMATLRLVPERDLALVVLTNAVPAGDDLAREMERTVLAAWGVRAPEIPAPVQDPAFDPGPYEGRYRNLMGTFSVTGEPGGLRVDARYRHEGGEDETDTTHLRPLGDGAFVDASLRRPTRALRFADPDPDRDGRCRSYFTGRIAWRVDDE